MSTHTEDTRPMDGQSPENTATEVTALAEVAAEPQVPAPSPAPLPAKKKKRGRTVRKIVTAVIALALVGAAVFLLLPSNNSQAAGDGVTYIQHTVSKRDIVVSLSGSGALQLADSYTVTSLVEGEILSDGFEEGDIVEKDAFLYAIDCTDLNSDIQRAENSLAQTRKSYQKKVDSLEDLEVTASASGTVIEVMVEEGDTVMSGQVVAVIRDIDTMSITLPFISDEALDFYIGQTAVVTIDGTF